MSLARTLAAVSFVITSFVFSSTALAWTPAYPPAEPAAAGPVEAVTPAHGLRRILGGGLRIGFTHSLFVGADFKHRAVRHTMGDMLRNAVIVSGTYEHEQKGDAGVFLLGAGFQF